MSGRYAVAPAAKAGINTANSAMWQIRAGASARLYLRELGVFVASAPTTAPVLVLGRASAVGTSSATVTPLPVDPNETASSTIVDTAWSVAPTFSTTGPWLRLAALPAAAGAGMIWTFDQPIELNVSTGLVIANLNAAGATLGSFGFYASFDE